MFAEMSCLRWLLLCPRCLCLDVCTDNTVAWPRKTSKRKSILMTWTGLGVLDQWLVCYFYPLSLLIREKCQRWFWSLFSFPCDCEAWGGLIGNCRPHCLQIDGIPISSHHLILREHDAFALKLSQPNQYFFFLNHHIHVEDVNIHGVCSAHLCTEVTLQPRGDHIQVEIRMKLCICRKSEYSFPCFGFCLACVTKAGINIL